MTTWLPTAALVGLAVAVLMGEPPRGGLRRLEPPRNGGRAARVEAVLLACALAAVWALFGWRVLGWLVIVGIPVATVTRLWGQARRTRLRAERARETARAAGTMALLLGSGRIPSEALAEAAEDCPSLAPAAAAVRLGGDAGDALWDLADEPGREGLAAMAAAWRVSEVSGAPVAGAMAQVSEALRQARQIDDVVATELSAARTSGRIMAALPFAAIGLGTVAGADPVGFLFGTPLGQWLLLGGVTLACAGVVWTEKMAQGGPRARGAA